MNKPHENLKNARLKAGYKTAADFSKKHDLTEATYRSHENGNRGIDASTATKYARLLEISPSVILFGSRNSSLSEKDTTSYHAGEATNRPQVDYSAPPTRTDNDLFDDCYEIAEIFTKDKQIPKSLIPVIVGEIYGFRVKRQDEQGIDYITSDEIHELANKAVNLDKGSNAL